MKHLFQVLLAIVALSMVVLAYGDQKFNLKGVHKRQGEFPTPSNSPTISTTPSNTPTSSSTPTISITPSNSFTPTSTSSITPTISITSSISITPTSTSSITPTISLTPSSSLTPSPTSSITPTISITPSSSLTPTPTSSSTPTISITPSSSVTSTPSASITPTISITSSSSLTPTSSSSVTPTISVTSAPSITPTPSQTTGASTTNTATASPSPSSTPAASASGSGTPAASASGSGTPAVSASRSTAASNSAIASPGPRGCPAGPGICNLTCLTGALEYIAVGYNPFVANSQVLFRWTQEELTNEDFAFPNKDPQTFTAAGDSYAPPFFCATDHPDPGTPALPDGSDPYYYLGSATEVHSNQGGVGSVTFNNIDPNNKFEVSIKFVNSTLLTQTQMLNPFTPCDLVVSQWTSVTYSVQKPAGTQVDSGIITCFLLKKCNSNVLYSCQTNCFIVPNGPGCISASATASILPSGASPSPTVTPFVIPTSNTPTTSSSTSPSPSAGTAGADGGNVQGSACIASSWLDVITL